MDYFLRPKPAFYTIKRELRPYTVGMTRKEHRSTPDPLSAADFAIETRVEVWGTNATLEPRRATLAVTTFDLADAAWREAWSQDVVLAPNASTELFAGAVPGLPVRTKLSEVPRTIVVSARLLDAHGGGVLARYANW